MTVTAPTSPHLVSPLRAFVARHPLAVMLLVMFGVSWALLIPPALAGLALEPFLLGVVLFAQLLPAVLVTGAVGGRPAVRQLFGRVFRWRVHPVWYLLALLGIPVGALLASTVFGPGAVRALVTDPSVILAYLASLAILPVVNLWEETAWMGVVQTRLARTRGPLLAAVITGPLFGLVHLPLNIGKPAGEFVLTMLFLMAFAIPLRIVLGWLYNVTGGSILLVAVTHATFNATNNTKLLTAAAPGNSLLATAPFAVVVVWALVVLVLTRGRLGARDDGATVVAAAPAAAAPVPAHRPGVPERAS
jgi:membrane protease YdiL (CAAX protease family)